MATHTSPDLNERPLTELFGDLGTHLRELLSEEVALARTELRQKALRVSAAGTRFGAAAAFGYAGLLTMIAGGILAGIELLDLAPWVATLLVGVVVLAIAGMFYASGRTIIQRDTFAPRQTLASLKENAAWIRSHTR